MQLTSSRIPYLQLGHHQTHSLLPPCNSPFHAFITYNLVITKHIPSSLHATQHFMHSLPTTWSSPNTFPPSLHATQHFMHSLSPFLIGRTVCLLNILRTVWWTMIRFLIEVLVRWTWFRQFDELYFVLNWLVMRCKLRPELAADSMIENVG